MKFYFTSGSDNPLNLSARDRRYQVVTTKTLNDRPLFTGIPEVSAREKRAAEIREQYGEDARVVEPYRPSRKQRRAQESRLRSKKGEK